MKFHVLKIILEEKYEITKNNLLIYFLAFIYKFSSTITIH